MRQAGGYGLKAMGLVAVAALFLCAGVALAQEGEPTAKKADKADQVGQEEPAEAPTMNAWEARKARREARRAARERLLKAQPAAPAAKQQVAAPAEPVASPAAQIHAAPAVEIAPTPPAPETTQPVAAPPAPEHAAAAHPIPATERGVGRGESHGASHGEHGGFSVGTFVMQLINFGTLLFLLIYFGGRAMNKSLRARHEQLKNDIGEAARARDEAKRKFDAQEQRVAELEKELAALRASMHKDAEREQARLVEAAQERAKRIQEEMHLQVDQQVKAAEALLRAEVASASIQLAEQMVRKVMNSDDERRLAQEFVAGFDKPTGPNEEVR